MKLWYLDNEYSDYVVMAETEDDAWEKLGEHGILPHGADDTEDECAAYHDIVEVTDGLTVNAHDDLTFLI